MSKQKRRKRSSSERRTANSSTPSDASEIFASLRKHGFANAAEKLEEKGYDVDELLNLTIPTLYDEIEIGSLSECMELSRQLDSFDQRVINPSRVFNDPIHGHIEIDPLCVRIIDTPQFQRLRHIKQLGGCYFVFPGASHNRFEHSLGVCYLAGELVTTLRKRQPELGITPEDVLCVKIAGLCHDLGHGPFSHLFDLLFIPRVRPEKTWRHEQASVDMFDHMFASNNLKANFESYNLFEKDIEFIKEQIAGPVSNSGQDWPYKGRSKSKGFLYEIVANKRNGIDVDKWDYFARDCHCLGISNNFDHAFARVLAVGDELQICNRDKEVSNLYDMFHTRNALHRRAYQHKTANAIEIMLAEAFVEADKFLQFEGSDRTYSLSETIDDMEAYSKLTDYVYHQILISKDPNLKQARQILRRIECRDLYRCVAQSQRNKEREFFTDEDMKKAPTEIAKYADKESLLTADDLVLDLVKFDYGMGKNNPIDSCLFYTKSNPDKAYKLKKEQVSQLLPEKFSEQHLRLYCRKRNDDEVCQEAVRCFYRWCKDNDCLVLEMEDRGSDASSLEPFNTPAKEAERRRSGAFSESSGGNDDTSAEREEKLGKIDL